MKPAVLGGIALGVTIVAAIGAWSTNQAIAWWVAVPEAEISPAQESSEPVPETGREFVADTKRSRTKRQLIDGIMGRNIFDHTAIGAMKAPVDVGGGEELTDLKLRLLATMVAEPASFSSALIANDDAGGQSNGYGIGDSIVSGAVIVEIEKKRVVLERNGKREILVFDEKDAPKRSGGRSGPSPASFRGVFFVKHQNFALSIAFEHHALFFNFYNHGTRNNGISNAVAIALPTGIIVRNECARETCRFGDHCSEETQLQIRKFFPAANIHGCLHGTNSRMVENISPHNPID